MSEKPLENLPKDSAVSVRSLTVHYEKRPVLWEINFVIPKGNLVGIVGPNGAGKSTLLKALLGAVTPLSGEILFFGKTYKEARSAIAYVPQRASVDWDFPINVFDVVLMGLYGKLGLWRWPKKKEKEAVESALEKVGMLSYRHVQISELSGGQQQRVFLARALVQEAEIYLMDEPFTGIDMATEKALVALLTDLQKRGKTIFIVHHDLTTVKNYFNWVILLNSCLIGSGPVEKIFHEENLKRTYGNSAYLMAEANKLAYTKFMGK